MSITDPIANMLTKIRNANARGKDKTDIKSSKINEEILSILKDENFIQNYKAVSSDLKGFIRVYLRLDEDKKPVIHGLKRISRPGLRSYTKKRDIPEVLSGLGITIISTSQGLMTGAKARELGLGGELVCSIW